MPSKQENKNQIAALILPAIIGMVAGVGYGVISHHAGFPVSLAEQFLPSIVSN